MNEPYQALASLIENTAPKAVVAFGAPGQTLAEQWCQEHDDCELTPLSAEDTEKGLSLPRTQDLALVTDCLEHLSHSQGQTLLGQLRNYGTQQIAVLVEDSGNWTLTDFIGLGFKRQARFEEGDRKLALYTYNIATYNHKRDWNNPRFWANPEMWDKARW